MFPDFLWYFLTKQHITEMCVLNFFKHLDISSYLWLLISSLIPLWSENTLFMIAVLQILSAFVSLHRTQSTLVAVQLHTRTHGPYTAGSGRHCGEAVLSTCSPDTESRVTVSSHSFQLPCPPFRPISFVPCVLRLCHSVHVSETAMSSWWADHFLFTHIFPNLQPTSPDLSCLHMGVHTMRPAL